MITTEDFTRVNSCANGNPRYVLHFLALDSNYHTALALAHECGGKVYNGKEYGGGFVFSTYNLSGLCYYLEHIKQIGLPVKATARIYKGNVKLFYYDASDLVTWDGIGGHTITRVGYYKKTKPLDKVQAKAIIKEYNQHYNANLVYSSRLNHN